MNDNKESPWPAAFIVIVPIVIAILTLIFGLFA
jgi:hypothetical protein